MARQNQKRLTPKQQALEDIEAARASLARHAVLAAEEWSPRAVITRSISQHRALWMGGAVLAGLAMLKLLWPSSHSNNQRDNFNTKAKNRGLFTLLLSPLLALGRKTAIDYAANFFESHLHRQVSPNTSDGETV